MKVMFFAYIRDYTGCREIDMEYCEDLEALLYRLSDRFGRKFQSKLFNGEKLSEEIIILVNGRHIVHLDGIHTKLESTDEISIFPVVAGG